MEELEITVRFQLIDNLKKYRSLFLKYYKSVDYPKGHIFNMAGLPVSQMYYLLEGTIFVYTTNENGYTRFMGTHQRNTIFNLDSLKQDSDAVITTKAFSDVKVIPLTIDDIIFLTKQDEQLYKDFLVYTAEVLRLMCYDAQAQSINDVKTRLIHFFILYTKDDQTMTIPLSQYRIGCAINASRIQVTRICSQLKELGLIKIQRNKIILVNKEALIQYCQNEIEKE